ncbi:hypothetical protein M422DRAFT_255107 [Sphaerobolus stellatus SS14]|uniref:Uncharacterized protein n=1 Tax=Sphaerobolus stellatus (strain SS14) TaxID=990650 RepID=A0A0C9UFK1_SPHS4|nr:hypothetical protein M422DRAFT_255107 [Sphaerobolus stellatus SS14]
MNSQQHPTHSLSTSHHNPYPSLSDVANRHVGNQGTFRSLNDENRPPIQASQPGSPWSSHSSVPRTPKANKPVQRTSSGYLAEPYLPSPRIESRREIEVRAVEVNAGIPQDASFIEEIANAEGLNAVQRMALHKFNNMTPEQRTIAQQAKLIA